MSRSNLRWAVIVLTVVTALVHLFLGGGGLARGRAGTLEILWLLNGIAYLVLLGGFLGWTPVLKDNTALTHYALIGFAAVTILAWVFMSGVLSGDPSATGPLPLITKIDEVLLIVVTFLHLRSK